MTTCPNCGSANIAHWRPKGDHGVSWHKCEGCGHLEKAEPINGEVGLRRFERLAQGYLEGTVS